MKSNFVMLFEDRKDAGRKLAAAIQSANLGQAIAIGLPRGGVVVAAEIARILSLPLDVIVPRKIGAPHNSELAIGALAGPIVWLDHGMISHFGIGKDYIDKEVARQKQEAKRRLALFRKGLPPLDVRGKTALVIDDGIATGSTMRVSLRYLKDAGAHHCIVAVPVGPPETIEAFKAEGYHVVCLYTPSSFSAVGQFYRQFEQTEDAEVIALLKKNRDGGSNSI